MSLQHKIEQAFAYRQKPANLISPRSPITPEQQDALSFYNRDWREVEWSDWVRYPDAFYSFIPEAFVYYLPSILIASIKFPERELPAAEALLGLLNRSPDATTWDAFLEKRLVGLSNHEYEVLKDWLISFSGRSSELDEDGLTRAYETVDLLARETATLRTLLK